MVNIVEMRAFPKRNIHSHHRVMQMRVDLGEYDGVLTSDLGGFSGRLLEQFPSLREHHCSRGYPGGLVERLREGTLLGHVLEHLILEMQSLTGCDVIYGKTRRIAASLYQVVVEYECEAVARAASLEAVTILNALLAGDGDSDQGHRALERLADIKREKGLGPSTRAIVEAAERRGIPAMRLNEHSLVQLGYGKEQKMIQASITGDTCCIGVDTAGDKALCKQLLADCGIPVPEGYVVRSLEEAVERARDLGGPLAIKPRRGNQGRGVSLNLEDGKDLELAYGFARFIDKEVLVEQFIMGQQYRVLVTGDEVVAASLRIPPSVTGDGTRTIRELVEELNSDPQRGEGHASPLTRVPLDDITSLTVNRQGFNLDSVPDDGKVVRLRDGANLSTGGTAVDVTDSVHPSAANVCRRAARIIGLDVAGVDLVTEDISQPFVDRAGRSEGAIVEVNAAPGLRMHQFPSEGRARDVGQAIVDHLFPQCQSEGRIPIVAITGSNGKTTATRLVEHLLSAAGYKTGMITSDGIYIAGEQVVKGDTTGPWSATVVLRDPHVEAAVLETARGGIIAGGLAFDYCDVAVVTNISSDHLGQDDVETLDDLVDVKSLVVETVPRWGRTVLNADDPRVMGMAERSLGEPILFSVEDNNLSLVKHLNGGGSGVYVSDGRLVWARGRKVTPLVRVADVPLTFGGLLEHNVQNLAAAAAAALAMGISPTTISKAMTDFQDNPGRFEVFKLGDRTAIVDYGHNAVGYTVTLRAMNEMKATQRLGVVGVPGDRRDSDIKAAGRVAARFLDRIIVKEDLETRGRERGEVAQLLLNGIIQASYSEEKVDIILDEKDAVCAGLDQLPPGGCLVVFYEDYDRIVDGLQSWADQHNVDLQRVKEMDRSSTQIIVGPERAAGMTSQ